MTRPTPTVIKKLAGNPGKRPMNEHEIKPTTGAPPCPIWLTGDALDEWNRIVPELDRLGVLTKVDNSVLVAHCAVYGEVVTTVKNGEPLKAALLAQLRATAGELGLTPAARAKLVIMKGCDNDPAEEFFH